MSAQSGTGEEVCAAVEAHGPFQPLLDRSCRPDSAGVLKWKQRIREELSHRSCECWGGAIDRVRLNVCTGGAGAGQPLQACKPSSRLLGMRSC